MTMQSDAEAWAAVWREKTDPELEHALKRYMWLAAHSPNSHGSRVQQLTAECQRRGRPDMIERARHYAENTPPARSA